MQPGGAGFISVNMVTKYAGQTGTLIHRQGPKMACQLYNDSMAIIGSSDGSGLKKDEGLPAAAREEAFRFQTHSGVALLTSSPHRFREISINAVIPLEYATLITIESFYSAFRQ